MAKKENERFVKVLDESGIITCSEVWVDTQTGVQYLYHASGNSGGLTVLVDAEGRPLLYRRTPDAPEYKEKNASQTGGGNSARFHTPPHFQKMSLRTGAHAGVAIRTLLRRTSCHVGKTDSHVALLLGMTISWICTALSYPP